MKTDPIYRERLLKLADFLDKLPEQRFDYSRWVGASWQGDQSLSCGTTACALGWACTMPEFQELGLRLVKEPGHLAYPARGGDEGGVTSTDRAAEHVFGLTGSETTFLFRPAAADLCPEEWGEAPGDTASAKEVAEHIRRFVEWASPLASTATEVK